MNILKTWQACAAACILLIGCATQTENRASSSGDPEADQRAEQRVNSSDRKDGDKTPPARTLYERLGGERTIAALVDDFTERTVADPRVNFERHDVRTGFWRTKVKSWDPSPQNIDNFKQHMVEFLTLAAGGPAQYTGREMGEVHKGMQISNNEFDAMVGDIKASMDKLGIPTREKRDLLAVIETTRKQIVEKQ
jgi:hemoglobin